MTLWRVEMFGGLRLLPETPAVSEKFLASKPADIFAFLALYKKAPHAYAELEEEFWQGSDSRRNSLHAAVFAIRKHIEVGVEKGSVLQSKDEMVSLVSTAVTTDVAEFESSLRSAQRATAEERTERLRQMSRLYRGPLLPRCRDNWADSLRIYYQRLFLEATQQLVELLEERGDFKEALDYAQAAVEKAPHSEEAWVILVRCLHRAGRTEAAHEQYRALLAMLKKRAISPSPATLALAEELRRPHARPQAVLAHSVRSASIPVSPAAAQTSQAAAQTSQAVPGLPIFGSRFFGREGEQQALVPWLLERDALTARSALVTVKGPGGVGKSRLAVETAGRLRAGFNDRVCFVALASLPAAAGILQAVADAVGASRSAAETPLASITRLIGDRHTLLILDNMEHIEDRGVREVRLLRERVPSLACLVTSQRELGLPGERILDLAHLSAPDPSELMDRLRDFPSLQLFLDRAQAVNPSFQVTLGNVQALAEVCRRLEGLPLAIELAAAQALTLDPERMLQRLRLRPLDLLVSRRKEEGREERHRSLSAALAWSYHLLPPDLQEFFKRLSVLRGDWTAADADAVCREPMAAPFLEELRKRSLVVKQEGGREARFHLQESLRQFSAGLLTDEEQMGLCRRHAAFFLSLTGPDPARAEADKADQARWLERWEAALPNFNAALTWCLDPASARGEEDRLLGLQLAGRLWPFWNLRGLVTEGRQWLGAALAQTRGLGRAADRIAALNGAGVLAVQQQDYAAAKAPLDEGLAAAIQEEEWGACGHLENTLGYWSWSQGKVRPRLEAFDHYLNALLAFWRAGEEEHTLWPLHGLGAILAERQEEEAAQILFELSLEVGTRSGDANGVACVLVSWNDLTQRRGAAETDPSGLLGDALRVRRMLKDAAGTATCLEGFGDVAASRGDWRLAVRLWASAARMREDTEAFHHGNSSDGVASRAERAVAHLRDEYAEQWDVGYSMESEAVIEDALSLS